MQFEVLPNLHWPDTMFTYIKEEKMLVTCDSFGAHYCSEEAYLSQIKDKENYYEARKYYYDCIISPFKDFMLKGIDFAKSLELSYIATGHGPIIDEGFEELFDSYTKWSTKKIREGVIIAYVSAYGYTEQLAKEIEKGIRSKKIEVKSYDLQNVDIAEVAEEVRDVKGLLIGSSTILSDAIAPAYELTINMHPVTHHGILASAFGSYGWSGEAVGNLIDRMKQLRMKTMDGFKIRFKPSEEELQQAYEFGVRFGEELEK